MTYFTRLPTQEGSRRCFTLSIWMKRSRVNRNFSNGTSLAIQGIFSGTSAGTTFIRFNDDGNGDEMRWYTPTGSTYHAAARRDTSNWTHYMWVVDTGIQSSNNAADRYKHYVNGSEVQNVRSQGYASLNTGLNIFSNSTGPMSINSTSESGQKGNHYMSDFFLIDGKALTPDVFGYFKDGTGYHSVGNLQGDDASGNFKHTSGIWQPKAPRMIIAEINRQGGFGGNGCYLPMNTGCNPGFDFRIFEPDTILKLKHTTPQPKNIIDGDPKQAVREDPLKDFLILACPFDVNGIDQGRGDYSALIRKSGTAKSITGNADISTTGHSVYGSIVNGAEQGSSANFNSASSQYYTLGNDSDFFLTNEDFTIECWVRQHSFATSTFFSLYDNTGGASARSFWFGIDSAGHFGFYFYHGSTTSDVGGNFGGNMRTGQWYHVAAERYDGKIYMYINGIRSGDSYEIGNTSLNSPANVPTRIGANYKSGSGNEYFFNGRLKDLRVYKGVAKYKMEGFEVPHLFQTHEWAYHDTVIDAPKTNFATFNHLDRYNTGGEHEEGGLRHDRAAVTQASCGLTHMVASGKWYIEVHLDEAPVTNSYLGLMSDTASGLNFFSDYARYVLWQYNVGKLYYNNTVGGSVSNPSYGTTPSQGDVIAMAFDADSRQIRFFVNGVEEPSVPFLMPELNTSGYHGTHYMFWLNSNGADQVTINTGQNPTFCGQKSLDTRYSDASGRGQFYYPVPDGYNAICSANLPAPIKDPGKYFRSIVYMGSEGSSTGITRQVKGTGFKPDFVWIKPINQNDNNLLFDSVRGPENYLYVNSNAANSTDDASGYGKFISFDKNGFTIGPWNNLNNSGEAHVAMCWKAGGKPTSALPYMVDDVGYATLEAAGIEDPITNTIIPTKMSVGKKQGFSIVNYTGNGATNAIVPHGLGKKPVVALLKNLDATVNFDMHMFGSYRAAINTAETDQGNGNTTFTEDAFILANDSSARNQNSVNYIAYIWAEIEGYSKFGQYRGNGDANGTFVYLGFKPAWLMVKQVDGTNSWFYQDTTRNPENPTSAGGLRADVNNENTAVKDCDFLSNGFKWRIVTGYGNDANTEYLYMAFAQSPFAHNLAE